MKDTTFRLRLRSEEKAAIEAAASREGRSASDWALRVLLAALEPGIRENFELTWEAAGGPQLVEEANRAESRRIAPKPVPIVDAPLPRSTPVEAAKQDLEQIQQRLGVQPFSKEMQAGRKKK